MMKPMNALRIIGTVAIALAVSCSSSAGVRVDAKRVVIAPSPWPTPEQRAPDAPPRILALWMNDTTIEPGHPWVGRIVTSTNVASVEIRTESFSFVADRPRFGDFEFSQEILDVIPQYHRAYTLEVIARNARGDEDERLVPIAIR
jgi:hypothetical protein